MQLRTDYHMLVINLVVTELLLAALGIPVGYRIQNMEYRIQSTEYRVQNTENRIQNTEYRIQVNMSAAAQHGWTFGRSLCMATGFVGTLTGARGGAGGQVP